jgi:hypothetical protein
VNSKELKSRMFGISLSKILQEAAITTRSGKQRYFSGGIQSIQALLEPANQAALQRLHNGLFCFLAFYPETDSFISEYVQKGSLASDSGRQIMVLFIAAREMRNPQHIQIDDLKIEIDRNIHPAYEAVSTLFPRKQVALPGIVFFDDFIRPKESVYVQIKKADSLESAAAICRNIFMVAQTSYQASKEKHHEFSDEFAIRLGKSHINYQRSGKTTFGEWLIKVYNIIYENKSDIIAAVGLLK